MQIDTFGRDYPNKSSTIRIRKWSLAYLSFEDRMSDSPWDAPMRHTALTSSVVHSYSVTNADQGSIPHSQVKVLHEQSSRWLTRICVTPWVMDLRNLESRISRPMSIKCTCSGLTIYGKTATM